MNDFALIDEFQKLLQLTPLLAKRFRRDIGPDEGFPQDAMTHTQMNVLRIIATRPEWRMSDLSEQLIVSPGSLTTMVNRLIKDGLVARKRSEDDRRVVTVRLTPAGRSELEKRQDMVRKHTARLLAELPDEKKTELIDAISVIVRVLGSLVEPEE